MVRATIWAAGISAADGSTLGVKADRINLKIDGDQTSPPQSISFVAPADGERILRFFILVASADDEYCGDMLLQAKTPVPAAAVPQNLVVHGHVGDTERNRIGDETNYINVVINGESVSQSVLQARAFLEIPLGPSPGRKQIAPGFFVRRFEKSNQQLRLRIPNSARGERLVFLNAGRALTLGKDDTNPEITLPIRTSPRANRDRISRRHATIQFNEVGQPVWTNHSCYRLETIIDDQGASRKMPVGGTRVLGSGRRLSEGDSIPLSTGLKLSLSDTFDVSFVVADAGDVEFVEYELFVRHALGRADVQLPEFVHSARIHRHDEFARDEEYVLFPTVGLIGRDPSCTIHLDHPSVGERHAWLWHLGQGFWIEPCSTDCRVQADGHKDQAKVNELIPLLIGQPYWLGDVKFFVERYVQPSLDKINRPLK